MGSTGFASSDLFDSFATLEDIRSRGVRVAEPLEVFDAALRSAVRIGSMSASFLVGRRVGSGGGAANKINEGKGKRKERMRREEDMGEGERGKGKKRKAVATYTLSLA